MKVRSYRVFYIDQESGIKEVIDLLKTSSAVKMALVIKNGHLLLNSTVNLEILKKYEKRLKKNIVIINPDKILSDKVSKAGFKMYLKLDDLEKDLAVKSSLENKVAAGREKDDALNKKGYKDEKKNIAQKQDNKELRDKIKRGQSNKSKNKHKNNNSESKGRYQNLFSRFLTVSTILIIIIMAYFYFYYPTATIEIQAIIQELNYELDLNASNRISNIDWENNILPLHKTEVKISGHKEIETTGVQLIGDEKASGYVRFINERTSNVDIPAGTIVKTDSGIEYQTLEDISVPGLEVDYLMDVPVGMKAGQSEVRVQALSAGTQANVSFGEVKRIKDSMENLHVINPEAIRGGSDKRISYLSNEDIERAKSLLAEDLRAKLVRRVYQELGGNFRIIEEKINFLEPNFSYTAESGDITDDFIIEGEVIAEGYLFKNNELDRLATNILKEKLSNNVELMSSGINIRSLKLEENGNNMYNVNVAIDAPVLTSIDTSRLARRLSGLDINAAERVLDEMANIDSYNIKSTTEVLPRMSFAINVVIREAEAMRVINLMD
ncbi:baseplate J/gp47 family protein [Natronospora cellulosivora (SeqCode)]